MHQDALAARSFGLKLTDRFEKGQAFDIADRAADFAQHEIDVFIVNCQPCPLISFVTWGNHLNGLAEVIALAFLIEHVGVDAPG